MDNGADAVYFGFRDATNARHFTGLNFDRRKAEKGIQYARSRGVKVLCAINTYPQPQGWQTWQQAVDMAADLQVNALIGADMGVLGYAAERHSDLNLHLSVQGSATNYEALHYYKQQFNIKRAVLPRVLSLAQVAHLARHSPVELEVFAFGSLCIMVEGRCYLSSYLTDESPNTCGACSPAKAVRWEETPRGLESRLNDVLIDRYGEGEKAECTIVHMTPLATKELVVGSRACHTRAVIEVIGLHIVKKPGGHVCIYQHVHLKIIHFLEVKEVCFPFLKITYALDRDQIIPGIEL